MTYEIYNSLNEYITSLIKNNLREDDRSFEDYREIIIEKNPLSQANGSARVKVGKSEVIVGVKLSVGEPFPDSSDEGILIVNAELTPLASEEFESGPPRANSIELARVIDRALRESHTIDVNKLCIKEGKKVWIVFVDVFPINNDGNLLDAGLIGALVALKNAKFPKYDEKTDTMEHRELTNKSLPLNDEPILCTFAKVGDSIIVDPTEREEEVMTTRLSVAINKKGNVCDMQKGGEGTLTEDEVISIIEKAQKLAPKLRKQTD